MWIILCVRRDQSKPGRLKQHVYCSLAKWHLVDVMKRIRCWFVMCWQTKNPFLNLQLKLFHPSWTDDVCPRFKAVRMNMFYSLTTESDVSVLLFSQPAAWLLWAVTRFLKKGTEDRSTSQNYSKSCSSEIRLLTTQEGIFPCEGNLPVFLTQQSWRVSYQKQLNAPWKVSDVFSCKDFTLI